MSIVVLIDKVNVKIDGRKFSGAPLAFLRDVRDVYKLGLQPANYYPTEEDAVVARIRSTGMRVEVVSRDDAPMLAGKVY